MVGFSGTELDVLGKEDLKKTLNHSEYHEGFTVRWTSNIKMQRGFLSGAFCLRGFCASFRTARVFKFG